jgi:hypothetical protein
MGSFWPGFFQAKYLKLKQLLPFWPEFTSQASDLFGFLARYSYLCSYILAWNYSVQDYHNFLTYNCKLSQEEWKAFVLDFFKPNT